MLLKVLHIAICDGYTQVLLNNPTIPFGITLRHFYTMFGDNNPIEKENSRMSMSAVWDGLSYKVLRARIEDGLAYTIFANVPLTNAHAINTLVAVILHTGIYVSAYSLWLALSTAERATSAQALDWWSTKCRIKKRTTKIADRLGVGMYDANVAQDQPAGDCDYKVDNKVVAVLAHIRQQDTTMQQIE